jgi:hypothetical protein
VGVARGQAEDWGRLAALRANLRERVACSPLGNAELFTGNLLALLRGVLYQN